MSLSRSGATFVLITLTVLNALFLLQTYRVNGDIIWLCYEAKAFLHGKTIYKDVFENNPPLILLIYAPLVSLSEVTDIESGELVRLFTLILSILSSAVATLALPRTQCYTHNRLSIFTLFAASLLLIPHADNDFGQREHLFIIFCLPYFIRMLPSGSNQIIKLISLAIAIFAGIGFFLKPYFLVVFATSIIARNILKRAPLTHLFIEDKIIICFGFVYAAFAWLLFPEFYANIPFVVELYRSYFWAPIYTALCFLPSLYFVIVGTYISSPTRNADFKFMLFVVIAAVAEALIQFKPWHYLTIPPLILTAIMVGFSTLDARKYSLNFWGSSILLAIILFNQPLSGATPKEYDEPYRNKAAVVELKKMGIKSIFVFSESFSYLFPFALEAGLKWSSRYPHFWMFNGIYGNSLDNPDVNPLPGKDTYSQKVYQEFIEDFSKNPPEAIFIDTTVSSKLLPMTPNFKKWIKNDKSLSNEFSEYRYFKNLNFCIEGTMHISCSYEVYIRNH